MMTITFCTSREKWEYVHPTQEGGIVT